jgi:hypothetical protein
MMNHLMMFVMAIVTLSTISVLMLDHRSQTALAWDCTWVVQWDELVPVCEPERDLLIQLPPPNNGFMNNFNNDHIKLNPQPLPPVINLAISPDNLTSTQSIKISNLGNGTAIISVVNATK